MSEQGGSVRPAWIRDVLGLVGFLALSLLVSAGGGLATATSVEIWYRELEKPALTPPDWVFPPVWSALFLLIAIGGWRVWRRFGAPHRGLALLLFLAQLALNLMWSVLFFGLRAPGAALVEIGGLLVAILATTVVFARVDRWAAACFVPYLLWVGYAAVLNAMIWLLNG